MHADSKPLRFNVRPEKERALEKRLLALGIKEKDLQERFIRSRGPGGQHVNKTCTGVYLKHMPTGVEAKATQARSQALNRFLARRMLAEKIAAKQRGNTATNTALDKIRRQKDRRKRRSKEKRSKTDTPS